MINGEIIVDNFAGGGGDSTGISVDIAINHDPEAIKMHKTNHPSTKHYCESVWDVDPIEVCAGRKVALAWFSPDCKHFSKVKGTMADAIMMARDAIGLACISMEVVEDNG